MPKRLHAYLIGSLLALAASAGSAAAGAHDQQPNDRNRHKWWQDPKLRAELNLTDVQAREVEEIFQSAVPRLRSLKQQLDQLEADLSRMIRERTADESTVAQQVDRVEATRSELSKARTLMLYRMHRILTADQNAKLKTMHDRERRDRDRKEHQE
jgi:Spy/CpxP family protein refolding chaperone